MYHPPSKKRQLFIRVLVSISTSAAVLLLVVFLVLYMLGYRFAGGGGRIEQSGLMQYVTVPNGATIEVDGSALSTKSPTKSSVFPGKHEFVMWRDDYETWRKTETVQAGTLMWLNYTRLVPKVRTVEPVASLPKAAVSLTSPESRYMAVLPDAQTPTIDFYNLQSDTVKQTSLTLPSSDYTDATKDGVTHSFEFVEWAEGDRYLLVKHHYNDAVEWLVLDREQLALEGNITKTMDIDVADAHFSGTSGHEFFVLSSGDVRKVDLSNETISRPLASNVAEFSLYGSNMISYVSSYDETTKQRIVGLVRDSDKQPIILKKSTSSPDTPLHVIATRYINQDFVIISEDNKVSISAGIFPDSTSAVATNLTPYGTFEVPSATQWLQVSETGRFVIAQTGADFVSFDLEWKKTSPVVTLAGTTNPSKLRWLDEYYIWSDRSDQLTMREFDGDNAHTINSVASGFDAALTSDGKYLYSIGRKDTGFELQRVKMILN